MSNKKRIDISGSGGGLGQSPFGGLGGINLPQGKPLDMAADRPEKPKAPKVRLEVRREKTGRGGKTVTVIRPLSPLPQQGLDTMAELLKRRLASGGRAGEGRVEVQGDHVQAVVQLLAEQGWTAFAGN